MVSMLSDSESDEQGGMGHLFPALRDPRGTVPDRVSAADRNSLPAAERSQPSRATVEHSRTFDRATGQTGRTPSSTAKWEEPIDPVVGLVQINTSGPADRMISAPRTAPPSGVNADSTRV